MKENYSILKFTLDLLDSDGRENVTKKIMSNKRQLHSCITLFCIHLPSCVQPRQDTTKFLHGSFSFFLNVDAALKIRILANSLTMTRTGLINAIKFESERIPYTAVAYRRWSHNVNRTTKGSFPRSGPDTSTFKSLYDMGVLACIAKISRSRRQESTLHITMPVTQNP